MHSSVDSGSDALAVGEGTDAFLALLAASAIPCTVTPFILMAVILRRLTEPRPVNTEVAVHTHGETWAATVQLKGTYGHQCLLCEP